MHNNNNKNTLLTTVFHYNLGKPAPEGKPFWILMRQKMMGQQWNQLNHMQTIYS